MTLLTKQVRREACRSFDGHRPIIVSLEPGDILGFRLKGCRTTFKTTIGACYALAVKAEVRARQLAKAQAKRNRR